MGAKKLFYLAREFVKMKYIKYCSALGAHDAPIINVISERDKENLERVVPSAGLPWVSKITTNSYHTHCSLMKSPMGNYFRRLSNGGDSEKLDPMTGLSKRDVQNIKRSWAIVYADPDKYGLSLFLRLFRLDPQTRNFFKIVKDMDENQIAKSVMFKAHICKVMSSLDTAVGNLHQPEVVIALMHKLGEVHRCKNVEVKHFDELKVVFVDLLKEELRADAALVQSWGRFVQFIYKHIYTKL